MNLNLSNCICINQNVNILKYQIQSLCGSYLTFVHFSEDVQYNSSKVQWKRFDRLNYSGLSLYRRFIKSFIYKYKL